LVVNAATVTSWSAWESVAVRMKSPAVWALTKSSIRVGTSTMNT
jgi:hypothetical protein